MPILEQAKNVILPIIENKNLFDEFVVFKTQGNSLYAKFLDANSEGLTYNQIHRKILIRDLFKLNLDDDINKELFAGFLNAFVNFYHKEKTTVFCKNKQFCFNEIGIRLSKRYGSNLSVCLIDEKKDNFDILSAYNFKIDFLSFKEKDFEKRLFDCIAGNFLVLCNGYCLTKSWADDILEISAMDNANRLVIFFGPQSAFVDLINLKRLCFWEV